MIILVYSGDLKRSVNMTPIEKINEVISEKLGVNLEEIVPEAHIIDDLGADSLDLVELIMSLEEESDIDISDEEAEKLDTVQSIYDFIKSKAGGSKWDKFNG